MGSQQRFFKHLLLPNSSGSKCSIYDSVNIKTQISEEFEDLEQNKLFISSHIDKACKNTVLSDDQRNKRYKTDGFFGDSFIISVMCLENK